jgi:acyl-CoA synthetase (AMP-forming)/AMP-acid ligase II
MSPEVFVTPGSGSGSGRGKAMENRTTSVTRAEHYRAQGWWTSDTLASRVKRHAAERGEVIAVVDQAGPGHSYRELCHDSAVVGQMLQAYGVEPGDVVSIQLPNRYETVVAAVAAQSIGAVINPLVPSYRTRELTHVFQTARPRVIFTPAVYRGWDHRMMIDEVRKASGITPVLVVVDDDDEGGDVSLGEVLARSDGSRTLGDGSASTAVSEVIFTSGTEAIPKAVMHTEETTNFGVRTAFEDLGVRPDQVVWMPSPVGHSTGFNYGVRAALYHGRTLVLQDRWDASSAIDLIDRYGCSFTLAATTFLEDLVDACERGDIQLPQMTHFGCGGAPVPARLVQRAEAVGVGVLRLYGSTEVLCGTWNRPDSPLVKRVTTDGPALSHTEFELRDEAGRPLALPAEGEVYIRGPNTSVGFFDDDARTATTYLDGGWVRSGDLARIDEDGFLTIVGRKKEIIIRGGVNVAPREIEDLLVAFPEVQQAAVVGVPDQRLGERGCACLVLSPGATLDLGEIVARLGKTGLATYKFPEQVYLLDHFPVTPSGKVQKHELLRQILADRHRQNGIKDE